MTKLFTHGFAFKSILASLLYLFSSSVWAGGSAVGTITYGPAATPVPTLSGVMLIMLALLLATIAFRILRQKENHAGRMMVLSLLAVGTLASGLGGVKLIDDAYAATEPVPDHEMILANLSGAEANLPGDGLTLVTNLSGAATTILGRETVAACDFIPPSGNPECIVGLKLADNAYCYVSVDCVGP